MTEQIIINNISTPGSKWTDMFGWCVDTFGFPGTILDEDKNHWWMDSDEDDDNITFIFTSKQHALQFKLRWMSDV